MTGAHAKKTGADPQVRPRKCFMECSVDRKKGPGGRAAEGGGPYGVVYR